MSVLSIPKYRGVDEANDVEQRRSTSSRLIRAVLVAIVVGVVAYVLARWLRSDDRVLDVEGGGKIDDLELGDDAREIVIDGPSDDVDQEEETDVDEDRFVEERSAEELSERASEDAGEESPEPGEMTVDEDIVDELVEEETDEDGDGDGNAKDEEGDGET